MVAILMEFFAGCHGRGTCKALQATPCVSVVMVVFAIVLESRFFVNPVLGGDFQAMAFPVLAFPGNIPISG